jgi:hypothetical protein
VVGEVLFGAPRLSVAEQILLPLSAPALMLKLIDPDPDPDVT